MFAGLVEVGSDKDLKILSANRTYVCLDIINKENIEHTAMEKIKTHWTILRFSGFSVYSFV